MKFLNNTTPWYVLFTLFLSLSGLPDSSHAEEFQIGAPESIRMLVSSNKFSGTDSLVVPYEYNVPRWTQAHHLEISVGMLHRAENVRPIVAIGPVWRFQNAVRSWFTEFSFAPTLLAGSTLGDRDLGGNVHFTSALSVGQRFARNWFVSARIQHISNGGLDSTNPGLDMVGLSITRTLR